MVLSSCLMTLPVVEKEKLLLSSLVLSIRLRSCLILSEAAQIKRRALESEKGVQGPRSVNICTCTCFQYGCTASWSHQPPVSSFRAHCETSPCEHG